MEHVRQESGRVNQKRRTRAAIVAAAAELLRRGQSPTIAEVADVAGVSRATAYRYFPTQAYLLSEAALEGIPGEVDRVLHRLDAGAHAADTRLDAVVRALQERTAAHEAGFRALLRLALEQPFGREAGQGGGDPVRRGARRVDWIERALAPVWNDLDEPAKDRIVGALSLCMGIEALVVLRDVCAYSPEQAVETSRWAAQAILRAALDEASTRRLDRPGGYERDERGT